MKKIIFAIDTSVHRVALGSVHLVQPELVPSSCYLCFSDPFQDLLNIILLYFREPTLECSLHPITMFLFSEAYFILHNGLQFYLHCNKWCE